MSNVKLEKKKWQGLKSFLAIGMALLGIDFILMVVLNRATVIIPLVLVGVLICILAFVLWIVAVIALKKYGSIPVGGNYMSTTSVVNRGIFGLVRHPQYLAYMFMGIGVALISQDWIIIGLSAVSIIFLFLGIDEEERFLVRKFGNHYKEYMTRVPKINLIARVKKRLF